MLGQLDGADPRLLRCINYRIGKALCITRTPVLVCDAEVDEPNMMAVNCVEGIATKAIIAPNANSAALSQVAFDY